MQKFINNGENRKKLR